MSADIRRQKAKSRRNWDWKEVSFRSCRNTGGEEAGAGEERKEQREEQRGRGWGRSEAP